MTVAREKGVKINSILRLAAMAYENNNGNGVWHVACVVTAWRMKVAHQRGVKWQHQQMKRR